MPIYEYRCEACSGTFERLIPIAEKEHSQPCPSCESDRTRVLVSSFAVSGFESAEFSSSLAGGGCCGGGCGCGCGSSAN